MSSRGKFDLDFSECPFEFEATFGTDSFYIGINYNELGDFYTADLYDVSHNPMLLGEKLVYGKCLWRRMVDERFPMVDILPLDESGQTHEVTKATLGTTVFLYQDSADGDEPDTGGDDSDSPES
ncbi:phage baseplate plug family protein [Lacticaseibacillus zhaodongensis]|uniref:phage baseplate plug family protein n=1 Tax=Lacticaseibacillus zhaodongensis TaxID=2668065 RepID=UPI0012D2C799|nr:hypothetical protein [Lacticaseibacillus zhaodongensis]